MLSTTMCQKSAPAAVKAGFRESREQSAHPEVSGADVRAGDGGRAEGKAVCGVEAGVGATMVFGEGDSQ